MEFCFRTFKPRNNQCRILDPKRDSPVFKWTMPEGYEGTVRVYAQATVAESREKFWTGIKSDVMTLTFRSEAGDDQGSGNQAGNIQGIS